MKFIWKGIGITLGAGVVAGGVATFVVLNEKQTINTHEANRSMYKVPGFEPKGSTKINLNDIRVANWNLKNFMGDKNRTTAMANIIANQGITLLGAEEVDKASALYDLAAELNKIMGLNSWRVTASKLSKDGLDGGKKIPMGGAGTWEYYGFVYDSRIVEAKPFENKTQSIGDLYENKFEENQYLVKLNAPNTKSAFTRPPFGAEFETSNGKDFTAVIAHLDSPGSKSKVGKCLEKNASAKSGKPTYEGMLDSKHRKYKTSNHKPMGTQELFEAEHIKNVMEYFNNINGSDEDMVFMGDTNIPDIQGGQTPFQNLIDKNYRTLFNSSLESSKTSMSFRATDKSKLYSNPYDKIFTNSPLFGNKGVRYDMNQASSIVDKKALSIYKPGDLTKISDHTMVYATLDSNKSEKGHSKNKPSNSIQKTSVDINNTSYYDLITRFGFHETEAMKVVYYRSIYGKLDKNNLEALLNHYVKGGGMLQRVKQISDRYNVKIDYSQSIIDKNKNNIIRNANDYAGGLGHTVTPAKLDINGASYDDMMAQAKEGIISRSTVERIMLSRAKGEKIDDAQHIKGKYPISKGESLFLDFSSASQKIENPLDINSASEATMLKYLVGPTYKLSNYHVYALLAYRTRQGQIKGYTNLKNAIGSYAAHGLGYNVDYTQAPVKSQNLINKLDINSLTKADFDKYFGTYQSLGDKIYNFILNKALKDKNHKGISSLDELKSADYTSKYWMEQIKYLFIADGNTVFKPAATTSSKTVNKYTFDELKAEAAKVGVTALKYKSSDFTPKLKELAAFIKFISDHLSASEKSDKDVQYHLHKKAFFKHFIIALNNADNISEWDKAKDTLKTPKKINGYGTHNSYKVFDLLKP